MYKGVVGCVCLCALHSLFSSRYSIVLYVHVQMYVIVHVHVHVYT